MTSAGHGVEMPDGSLRFDPGSPAPETVPAGYVRDESYPWRLALAVEPKPCLERTVRPCIHRTGRRWYCERKAVFVNPAACCRCQGLLAALS